MLNYKLVHVAKEMGVDTVALNTVPWDKLRCGDKVISSLGWPGIIIELDAEEEFEVTMEFISPEIGEKRIARWYHPCLGAVKYIIADE